MRCYVPMMQHWAAVWTFGMLATATPVAWSNWGATSGFRWAFVADMRPGQGLLRSLSRLMGTPFVFPSTPRWLLLGGATAALSSSIMGLHGERSDALAPRLDPTSLAFMMVVAGFSSALLSAIPLRQPMLRHVPITGGEAAAFAAAWYWYLMTTGEEIEEMGGLPGIAGGSSGSLMPSAPLPQAEAADSASGGGSSIAVGSWTHGQTTWTAKRLIEGFTLWNVGSFVRSFIQVRRAATPEAMSAVAAKAASSPLPTLRPFGIPAIVGMLVAPTFYRGRMSQELSHHNMPVHV